MTKIYKAEKTGYYFVNGIGVDLLKWRNGKRFGLKQEQINKFDQYIKDYKLDLR